MVTFIPLGTSIIASVFTVILARQYLMRRKVHQLVWTVAMSLFTVGVLVEFAMSTEFIGISSLFFKIYYLSIGPQVGLLGAGVLYLLSPKWGRISLYAVVGLSTVLLATGVTAEIDLSTFQASFQKSVAYGIRDGVRAFPSYVRGQTILLNIIGGVLLIGGALFSFAVNRKRYYALFLAGGGILNGVGGSLLGILGNPDVFFEFEFLGAVLLFTGFMMSYRSRLGAPLGVEENSTMVSMRARMVAMSGVLSGFYLMYAFMSSVALGRFFQGVDIHFVRALVLTIVAVRLAKPWGASTLGFISAILLAVAPFSSPDKIFLIPATLAAGVVFDLVLMAGRYEENVLKKSRVAIAAALSGLAESLIVVGGLISVGWPFADSAALLQFVLGAASPILLFTFLVGRNIIMSVLGASLGRVVLRRMRRSEKS